MGKNELSEAGTSMVRDNMANFRRDMRKTRVTGYPGEKACFLRHGAAARLRQGQGQSSLLTTCSKHR